MTDNENTLGSYLARFKESDWLDAIEELLPCMHDVDRDAVRIWFRFYPLALRRFVETADSKDEAVRGLALQGEFDLAQNIDTSHHFLYGHRYWATLKRKIAKESEEFSSDDRPLTETIKSVACRTARKLGIERSLVNAIAAVGLATFNQVGNEAFFATAGETEKPTGIMAKSPDAIVEERARDDSQGIFGFLKTVDKRFSVRFAGVNHAGKFPVTLDQQLTHAASQDRSQEWRSSDERCWDGPIPIECTAASCGTCWIGVLGGREKLSPVSRRERRAVKVFGYNQPEDDRPFLRLACQAKAFGNITIVIPPWNGVFGKKVYGNVEEVELEPVTTSAKALRKVVKVAGTGENHA